MPISDMWQDVNGLDTMGEMDSNGSCDSVVSFNSCFVRHTFFYEDIQYVMLKYI